MSASTAGSTAGGTVEVVEVVAGDVVAAEVASVEGNVTATVVGTSVGATTDGETAGVPDAVEAELPELHAAIPVSATVRQSSRAGSGFDLTAPPSAHRGEQAPVGSQIDLARVAGEVVFGPQVVEAAEDGRLDDAVDPRMTHRLLVGDAGSRSRQGRSVDVDEADRQDLPGIVQGHRVEDPGRYSEPLVGLPRLDEVLELGAFLQTPAEQGDDHGASVSGRSRTGVDGRGCCMLICMQSTSVRIDTATHEDLKRLASELHTTVGNTVTLAVRALRQQRIGGELRAALRPDETVWLDAELG